MVLVTLAGGVTVSPVGGEGGERGRKGEKEGEREEERERRVRRLENAVLNLRLRLELGLTAAEAGARLDL